MSDAITFGQYQMMITDKINVEWFVGYHIKKDELFLWRHEDDDTIKIMRKQTDLIAWPEFVDMTGCEQLGVL